MNEYMPQIGDAVYATRKVKSKNYYNYIIGLVVDTWTNACRVHNNPGTNAELDIRLYYSDWNFMFLHKIDAD